MATLLSQQLGFFSGKEIQAFAVHAAGDSLLYRSQNRLNCTVEQDTITLHINTADVRLIRDVPGADPRISKREEKTHALPKPDRFSGCLQLADYPCGGVKRVVFLADRGFRDCDWAILCHKIGWHYDIRVASNTYVTLKDGRQLAIDALGVPPGQWGYFQEVKLTQDEKLQGNLSVTWTNGKRGEKIEIVAVISDQLAEQQRLDEYARRMRIEESFRDDQSGGFDLEHTRLEHPARLERLLLAIAIATLWCHEIGEQVLQDQTLQDELDPGGIHRELSIFQLGLRFLRRCISTALHRLPDLKLVLTNLSLDPVLPRLPVIQKCQ